MKIKKHQKGYVTIILLGILLACVAGAGVFMRYQSARIEDLSKELTSANSFITLARTVNENALAEIENLKGINQLCIGQRTAAEDRANRASEAVEAAKVATEERLAGEAREIRNENTTAVCSMPVPSRTVQLLVAAANRANQGSGSQ